MIRAFLTFVIVASGLAATPVQAQDGLGDLVQIEVLDGGRTERGTHQAAIRLILADGWKTYWRAPGDAGIPPSLTWSGSQNVQGAALVWPTPEVFDQGGLRSIGYTHQLVLPVEITPKRADRPVRLRGRIAFGICSDVCVPAELAFDRSLDAGAARDPAIVAALAARPYSASEAGLRSAVCVLEPARDGMRVTVRLTLPSTGRHEIAVIEPGNPKIWASEAQVTRRGNVLIAVSDLVHVEGAPYALDRSQMRITVLGQRHAVDIRGCSAD